ncbi:sorting nexin-10A isoform X3 [Pungitius pungitius]|uniref:sorting nexin-10A isoform X3 n=1 Tax=Pungitius pungitius TaxID=134920 RepID=UPI002E11C5B7
MDRSPTDRGQGFVPTMDSVLHNLSVCQKETISVCVRDPRFCKDDLWHSHIDYEICLQTNSMCFRKKTSRVRRRYSEFVWLRHCLEQNALVMELPKLPPRNPFFSLKNTEQVTQRMKGFQEFLERCVAVAVEATWAIEMPHTINPLKSSPYDFFVIGQSAPSVPPVRPQHHQDVEVCSR